MIDVYSPAGRLFGPPLLVLTFILNAKESGSKGLPFIGAILTP